MKEAPIERLNYYDGQRLQARDFKLEQEFHIRVQRWLTKSFFSPGIADGLEVIPSPDPGRLQAQVTVQPGLAIDDLGRAVILVEPVTLDVRGRFLTIAYDEQKTAPETDECGPSREGSKRFEWGGPSRIAQQPRLSFRDGIPRDGGRELTLARFDLDEQCRILGMMLDVRRYAGAAQLPPVRSFALEGEKDLTDFHEGTGSDAYSESKVLRFHVRGRRPSAVTLYLRGARFSTAHYTELGGHNHDTRISGAAHTDPASGVDPHQHTSHQTVTASAPLMDRVDPAGFNPVDLVDPIAAATAAAAALAGAPTYPPSQNDPPAFALRVATHDSNTQPVHDDLKTDVGLSLVVAGAIGPETLPDGSPLHTHPFNASFSSARAGASLPGVTGPALGYFDALRVFVDGSDVTDQVLAQARENHPDQPGMWSTLGDHSSRHPIVASGTGPIRLDLIEGFDLSKEEHEIEMRLMQRTDGQRNGGRVQYNLYVE